MTPSVPLLIVGGRTTGLMMAVELTRHGVPVRIVDKSPGIDPHSRATLLHSRTLEILSRLGVADQITAIGQPMRRVRLFANGEFVGQSYEDAVDSPFPHGIALSQAKTEAILQRHLNGLGVHVERSTQLTAMEQREDCVRATLLHDSGQEEIVETPYLVGCDGAHSTVRHLIDEQFAGEADPFPYMLADVIVDGPLEPDDVHIYLHDEGELFFFVLDEGRRLVVASGPKGCDLGEAPTIEQMRELVKRRSLEDFHLSDPRWLTCFHIQYRLVPNYRHGRVFLAGDAAHIHSLIGGQGMNTGIQDAHNLAWKLALVLQGIVPESWLGTYGSERRGVAEDVITMTKLATQSTELFAELSAADRTKLCEHMFVPESEKAKARRHAEALDLDYRSSPLCIDSKDMFSHGPHAGSQAVNVTPIRIDGIDCALFDLIPGTKHSLILFTGPGGDAELEQVANIAGKVLATQGHWIEVFVVIRESGNLQLPIQARRIEDPQGAFHERYDARSPCMYLVRPDGYVAYRSHRLDGLDAYLAKVMHPGDITDRAESDS